MNPEIIQLLFYAGFGIVGWWLRHKGILAPGGPALPQPPGPSVPAPARPAGPISQEVLIEILKAVIDKLGQPTQPLPSKSV